MDSQYMNYTLDRFYHEVTRNTERVEAVTGAQISTLFNRIELLQNEIAFLKKTTSKTIETCFGCKHHNPEWFVNDKPICNHPRMSEINFSCVRSIMNDYFEKE